MMRSVDNRKTETINKLEELIEDAPEYGFVSLKVIFHNGAIERYIITKEESRQLTK